MVVFLRIFTLNFTHYLTKEIDYRPIDTNNDADVEMFEKSFYKAFVDLHSNQLIKKIWDWDSNRERLRTKIPYSDLEIYSWRNNDDTIKSAIAANVNVDITQFSQFGFSYPADGVQPHCEIVAFFTDNSNRTNGIHLNSIFLKSHCVPYIHSKGFKSLYSTCAEKPLNTYLRWGWQVLEETIIENEKRYFIYFDIEASLK